MQAQQPSPPSARPRVFISSSHKDDVWRERLKKHFDPLIDCWDDSRIQSGSLWVNEIEAAIASADIAVILLSPAYLSSKSGEAELIRIGEGAKSGGLKLFPVVLEQCAWSQFPFLSKIQIWAGATPLITFPPEGRESELAKIADSILELASTIRVRPLSQDPPRFVFSDHTATILTKARSLAAETRRPVVTSSCLLFAFAECVEVSDTARFVRAALDEKGGYAEAWKTFLGDGIGSSRGSAVAGLEGSFSPNVIAAFEEADSIAFRVGHGRPEIHPKHLFAALLTTRDVDRTQVARTRLANMGIDLAELAARFLEFVLQHSEDDRTEWTLILSAVSSPAPNPQTSSAPSSSPQPPSGQPNQNTAAPQSAPAQTAAPFSIQSVFVDGTPGYTSEFCGVGGDGQVPDHLGVENLAHCLAELIVLRETKLPLAVGLFGNWGSGKSHFMNLMDRHMKMLARYKPPPSSDGTSVADGPWCREIVPIYFNAWHYSDSNLWASLVTEVFDRLFSHLQPGTDELALLQSRLRDAGGVTALAEEEDRKAAEGVRQATAALQDARSDSEGAKEVVRGLLNGLRTLLPELNTAANRKQVENLLGVSADDATLSALIQRRKELSSMSGRIKELWRRATAPEGRGQRFGWLAGALLALGLAALLTAQIPQLQWLGPRVKAAIVFLGAAMAWLTPAFKQVQSALGQLEKWQKKAEDAQAGPATDPEVIKAQQAVARAEARASAAENALQTARNLEMQLTQAIDDLKPERRLTRFIEARARSADYRGQLGLVSLARRDFEELSGIFADTECLQRKIDDKPEQAAGLQKLSASVDRVVLYIDDLDRCEPEKVVDVLQAVHLLLAYRLFAVVVGVDQRCLKQSLRIRFKGLLSPVDQPASRNGKPAGDDDEIPTTPLDYLEKIFHIPFHLPPMDEHGFAALVESLTEPPAAAQASRAPGVSADLPAGMPSVIQVSTPREAAHAAAAGFQRLDAPASVSPEAEPVPLELYKWPSRRSVPLERWERDALKQYHSLIRTPRAATRLLNTYRLIRAGVSPAEWDTFSGNRGGSQEFRIAMLLLAVAAGQPAVAREWFTSLRLRDPAKPPAASEPGYENLPDWASFCQLYSATLQQLPVTPQLLTKWSGRVERFAF